MMGSILWSHQRNWKKYLFYQGDKGIRWKNSSILIKTQF